MALTRKSSNWVSGEAGNVPVVPLVSEVDGHPLVEGSVPAPSTGSHRAASDPRQPAKMRLRREKSASQSWTPAPKPAHPQLPLLLDAATEIRLLAPYFHECSLYLSCLSHMLRVTVGILGGGGAGRTAQSEY